MMPRSANSLKAKGNLFRMQAKNEQLMGELVESVTSLARIAHLHEQRLSGLEDRP